MEKSRFKELEYLSDTVAVAMRWKRDPSGWRDESNHGRITRPFFAIDPRAADEVRTECKRRGWHVEIGMWMNGDEKRTPGSDWVKITAPNGNGTEYHANAPDWPEAMCRAFLDATESEKKLETNNNAARP